MANRVYKTPRVNNKTGDVYTRETTSTTPDGGVQVTAWTDEAWNRAQEAQRRYQEDQEWQRNRPTLAWMRNAGRNVLDGVGRFVNDEILLNPGNIRVRNAQAHPEGLKWFREGGNEAVALLGLATAPMWLPEVAAVLPTLSGAGEGSLLSTIIPQIASRTAPQLANMLNWGTLGLGTYAIGRALSEDTPTFSLPVPQFGSRYMATTAPTAPADFTAVGAGNPPVAPSDSTSVAPAQPAAGGATDTGSSTASPAPASPEPERNDSTSNKAPFLQRVRPHLRPFGGYKGGSYMGNAGRLLRDAAYTGFGADVGFNLYESAENPDYQWKWGISRLTTFPERGVLQQLRRIHNSTPGDSIRPAQTQSTQQQGTQVVASPDSVMPMQVDPVAPNDTLNIF